MKLTSDQLIQKYDDLLKDQDFEKLNLELKSPNIFQILKITKREIRHSNFLSWLLDPNQSHKLKAVFLKEFLKGVFSSNKFGEINHIDVEEINLIKADIKREWKNIDILIELEDIVVCIENKVLSKEHSDQLTRYKKTVELNYPDKLKIFVFLTPEGDDSKNEFDSYVPVSYNFIAESLERVLDAYKGSLDRRVINYIKDYIIIIKRELMGTDKMTELANKIYKNHKELIDFISERKDDPVDRLRNIMVGELAGRSWILGSENKYYVRFLTPKIQHLVYYGESNVGWKKGESFLFEIVIWPESKKLHFKTVISPSQNKYDSKRLEKILMEIDGFRDSKGDKWLINKDIKKAFNYEKVSLMSDEEIKKIINNFYDKLLLTIKSVEEKLLHNENELLKMKNILG